MNLKLGFYERMLWSGIECGRN